MRFSRVEADPSPKSPVKVVIHGSVLKGALTPNDRTKTMTVTFAKF